MARDLFAKGEMYRSVIEFEYDQRDQRYIESRGPYSKLGTAEGQLTTMWKSAKLSGRKLNIVGWIEKGEVAWIRLPNRDDKAGTQLTNLEEELWNG